MRHHAECSGNAGPVSFSVRVVVQGRATTYRGSLAARGDESVVTTFTVR